eukprot:COSAG02_NODE_32233_length_519_cov_1.471429_2_plen_42_part_01
MSSYENALNEASNANVNVRLLYKDYYNVMSNDYCWHVYVMH